MTVENAFCIAGRGIGPGQIAMNVYAGNGKQGDIGEFCPTEWDTHLVVRHFLPCSDFYTEASYLVALEYLDDEHSYPVYFGDHRIDGAFIVVAFHEGVFKWLHCVNCASAIQRMIYSAQGDWGSVYKAKVQ